jgi:hypothetical protein
MVSTYMSFKFLVCSYLASLNCMCTSTILVYYLFKCLGAYKRSSNKIYDLFPLLI